MDITTAITLVASVAALMSAGAAVITAFQAGRLAREADERKAVDLRKGVAGAILGELEAYLELLDVPTTRTNLLNIAAVSDPVLLKSLIGAFPDLPKTHPVFDQCAHQIGVLRGDLPREVSKMYNIVTGFRLTMTNLASPGVAAAPDAVARNGLVQLVIALDKGQALADDVLPKLRAISAQVERPWGAGLRRRQ